ncbi:MAG: hypothetical protein ABW321_13550 [Polyangiales bacterium]
MRLPAAASSTSARSCTSRTDLTDGREGGNVVVVNDRLALFNVYHGEREELGDSSEAQIINRSSNYHL